MPDDHTARTADAMFPPAREPQHVRTSDGLPPALFEIAIAAMWSNGELDAREVERGHALVRQLRAAPHRQGSPFGAIAAGPVPFDQLDFDSLDTERRCLAYAIALWVGSQSDSARGSARRHGFLRGLQLRLRIDDRDASKLRDVVSAIEATADDADTSLGLLLAALEPLR